MAPFSQLLLFVIFMPSSLSKKPRFHPILFKGSETNPGLKMRLQEKGINELNRVALNLINEEITNFKFPDSEQDLPNNRGRLQVKNTRLSIVEPGESQVNFKPPNFVSWGIKHLDLTIDSDLGGQVQIFGPVNLTGHLTVFSKEIGFEIEIAIEEKNRRPSIRSTHCKTTIKSVDATLENGGEFQGFFDTFKGVGIDQIKPQIEAMLCEMVTKMIDQQADEWLQEMPVKVALSEVGKPEFLEKFFNKTPEISFGRQKRETIDLERMFIDYGLQHGPRVTSDFVESRHKGEVSFEGRGKTPFGPSLMHEPYPISKDRMFYFYLSDFTLNSLFFHAFKNGEFNFEIPPKSLQEICEKTALCDFRENTFLNIRHRRAPATIFGKNGTTVDSRSFLRLLNGQQPIALVKSNLNGTLNLWLNDSDIFGNLKYQLLDYNLTRSAKDFNPEMAGKIQKLAAFVLENWSNDFLDQGLPLPSVPYINLVRPLLLTDDRTLIVETDFELDQNKIRSAIRKVLKNVELNIRINTP